MNGAQIAVEALRREGVRHIFGLPGTTVMHLIDAAGQQPGLRYISARHEQVAAFMADGYARASGEIGVCLASRGPGAANLAIGIHNARAESVPVLALVGQVSDDIYYRDAFEEMDLRRPLGDGLEEPDEIHLLEGVPVVDLVGYLAHEGQHGHRLGVGVMDADREVGRAWPP